MARNKLLKVVENVVEHNGYKEYRYAPIPTGIEIIENINYVSSIDEDDKLNENQNDELRQGETEIKDDVSHMLDIIYPKNKKDKYAVIIHVHGGGFSMNSKERNYKDYAITLASDEFVVVNTNYRLSTEAIFPAQIQDILSVVKFIETNADKYQFDTEKVYAIGDSAGAYIVSMLECIMTHDKLKAYYNFESTVTIRAIAVNCGMFDFDTFMGKDTYFPFKKELAYQLFGSEEFNTLDTYMYSSVLKYITSKYCPVYLMDTELLSFASQGRRMEQVLKDNNIRHKVHMFSKEHKLIHSFNTLGKTRYTQEVLNETFKFFHKYY